MKHKKDSNKELNKESNKDKQVNMSSTIIDLVGQIVELYPELKKDKDIIIQKIINKQEPQNKTSAELIFDKIILDNIVYYKDKNGYLWNSNATIVGIYESETKYLDSVKLLILSFLFHCSKASKVTNQLISRLIPLLSKTSFLI